MQVGDGKGGLLSGEGGDPRTILGKGHDEIGAVRHLGGDVPSEPLIMLDEAGDPDIVHHARIVRGCVGPQRALLLDAPVPHDAKVGSREQDEQIDARKECLIVARQRIVDVAALAAVFVLISFESVDRPDKIGLGLWSGAHAPAFQDQKRGGGFRVAPLLERVTVVTRFVEAQQARGLAAIERLDQAEAEGDVVGAGTPRLSSRG